MGPYLLASGLSLRFYPRNQVQSAAAFSSSQLGNGSCGLEQLGNHRHQLKKTFSLYRSVIQRRWLLVIP